MIISSNNDATTGMELSKIWGKSNLSGKVVAMIKKQEYNSHNG